LTVIYIIDSCNLGDEGAAAIGSGIKKNFTLKTIFLRSNLIGDQGAFAIANGLASPMAGVIRLDLSTNKITDEGGIAMIKGLEMNRNVRYFSLKANFLVF
jgi:hypothetical protein